MAKNVVKIWSYSDSGPDDEPRLLGQVCLVDGKIRFEGMSEKLKRVMEEGIAGPNLDTLGLVFPKDGRAFLEALPWEFSGSMVRAELVEE